MTFEKSNSLKEWNNIKGLNLNQKTEKIFLYDSSILSLFYLRKSNGINNYASLDSEILSGIVNHSYECLELFNKPDARTIPEVTIELGSLVHLIGERQKRFFSPTQTLKNPKKYKYLNNSLKKALKNEQLYSQLQKNVFNLFNLSKKIKIIDQSPPFYSLLNLVELIVDKRNLKKNFKHDTRKIIHDGLHTDQKLVALAYKISLYHNTSVELVTNDLDIARMSLALKKRLNKAPYIAFSPEMSQQISQKPVKTFIPYKNKYVQNISFSNLLYNKITFLQNKEISSAMKIHFSVLNDYLTK